MHVPELVEAAIAAARERLFIPARAFGKMIAVWIAVSVTLRRSAEAEPAEWPAGKDRAKSGSSVGQASSVGFSEEGNSEGLNGPHVTRMLRVPH